MKKKLQHRCFPVIIAKYLKVHSRVEMISKNWKSFKNDEILFISCEKLFSFSKYLHFCRDLLLM